jgi:hypothetical protein
MVNTVVTDETFEQEDYDLYPIVHIVAGPWNIQGKQITNKFLLVCLDLGSEDGTNRYDNLSDTQEVLSDILIKLHNDGADLDEQYLEWEISGDATKIVDGKGDNASGWLIEIYANQTYQRNACESPIPA